MNQPHERRTTLETQMISLICNQCRQEMKTDGLAHPTTPAIFQYTCPNCAEIYHSTQHYPRIEYVEIGAP